MVWGKINVRIFAMCIYDNLKSVCVFLNNI